MGGYNWSELLPEMLEKIASKCMLMNLKDYVMFSCVCSSWNKAATTVKSNPEQGQIIPWLMLSNDKGESRNLFDLRNNKCYNLSLPEAYKRKCLGTGSEWVLTIGLDYEIGLFNPLTRASLPLPSYQTFVHQPGEDIDEDGNVVIVEDSVAKLYEGTEYYYGDDEMFRFFYIRKALVQEDKESRKLLVVVIYDSDKHVAAAKPEDSEWTHIDGSNVHDIVYSPTSGLTLFVQGSAFLSYCDLRPFFKDSANRDFGLVDYALPSSLMTEYYYNPKHCISGQERFYLVVVESSSSSGDEDIMMVCRTYDEETVETNGLEVYKLDLATKEWEYVWDLGDVALFVGNSPGVSVKPKPGSRCKANSIYCNDDGGDIFCYWGPRFDELGRLVDNVPGGWDMGVCDYAELDVQPFYHGDDYMSHYSVPIWLLPKL